MIQIFLILRKRVKLFIKTKFKIKINYISFNKSDGHHTWFTGSFGCSGINIRGLWSFERLFGFKIEVKRQIIKKIIANRKENSNRWEKGNKNEISNNANWDPIKFRKKKEVYVRYLWILANESIYQVQNQDVIAIR